MQDTTAKDITARRLRNALRGYSYHHANEIELHRGIAEVLTGLGLAPEREVRLSSRDRIDFLVDLPRAAASAARLGIEVKIAGRSPDVWRQLTRYAGHDRVDELLLVTTIARHARDLSPLGGQIDGKPLQVCLINRGLL